MAAAATNSRRFIMPPRVPRGGTGS
jgi:hypothetical protein